MWPALAQSAEADVATMTVIRCCQPAALTGHMTSGSALTPAEGYPAWLIPWGKPLTLLANNPEQAADAQCELARVGIG